MVVATLTLDVLQRPSAVSAAHAQTLTITCMTRLAPTVTATETILQSCKPSLKPAAVEATMPPSKPATPRTTETELEPMVREADTADYDARITVNAHSYQE